MWQGILVIGVLVSLALVILYSALVVASNADEQAEKYLIKEKENG